MPDSQTEQALPVQSIENPQPIIPATRTSSNRLPVIIITLIIIGLLASTYIFLLRNKPATTANNVVQPSFPINPSNKAIRSYGYYYQFQGTLVNILEVPNGIKLTTSIQGKNIPEFIIDKSTIIVGFDKNNQPTLFTPKSLEAGDKVKISAYYDMNKKKWRTSRIIVDLPPDFTNSVSESTKSANQK